MKQTDRIKINEIRIYYSFWKNMLMAIGSLAFAACGWLMIHDIHITRPSKVYIGIAGMVFFWRLRNISSWADFVSQNPPYSVFDNL